MEEVLRLIFNEMNSVLVRDIAEEKVTKAVFYFRAYMEDLTALVSYFIKGFGVSLKRM